MPKFHEHLGRSILKAITFRIFAISVDLTVVFLITRSFDVAIVMALIFNFTNTFLYIIHERIWNGVHWGKSHRKL
jgi:uncharacterized membrane protein